MPTRIVIHGAGGRMGQRLVALGSADEQLELVGAIESDSHPAFGKDAGLVAGIGELGVRLSNELPASAQAVIDFSVPDASQSVLLKCKEQKVPLVLATTGFNDEQKSQANEASEAIPLVWAPNMSLAVNLTMKLAETAAGVLKDLPSGADVEIIERHHRYKEDAPSGTALKFGELISNIMGQSKHSHGREGITGQRPRDEIGYHALRVGDNPGEHTIVFGLLGETIELTVRATNRDCYALGALTAAKFVAGQQPGIYSMYDVLGL